MEQISNQNNTPPVSSLSNEDPLNQRLSTIFLKNSSDLTSNEMSLNAFLEFCQKYKMIDSRNLTQNDCRLLFQKTLKLGQYNNQLINEFIAYDKRIQYLAFRDITIPLLANKTKQSVTECVSGIIETDQILLQESI